MARRRGWSGPVLARVAEGFLIAMLSFACDTAPPSPTDAAAGSGATDEFTVPGAMALLLGPWRPEPVPLWPALLQVVAQTCARSMQPFPPAPLVAVDARGEGRLQALFAGPGGVAMCNDMTIDADGRVEAAGGGMTSMGSDPQPAIGAAQLRSAGVSSSSDAGGRVTTSLITGQAGQGIARVVVEMPGRQRMGATLAQGWYLFWFPGEIPAGTRVIGLDVLGANIAESDTLGSAAPPIAAPAPLPAHGTGLGCCPMSAPPT